MRSLLFVALLVSLSVTAAKVSFHGHRVLRVEIKDEGDFQSFSKMVEATNADVWTEPRLFADATEPAVAEVRVSPDKYNLFTGWLDNGRMKHSVIVDDVEDLLQRIVPKTDQIYGVTYPKEDFFREYQSYENVVAWVIDQADTFPNISRLVNIGTSFEGRAMYALEIAGAGGFDPSKPTIFYNGGTHAREWIGSATTFYILHSLLSNYGIDAEVTSLIDSINWVIVPLHNVDGYAYTHNFNTQWRKTRKPNPGAPECVGTDPNRNWDIAWNEGPTNPCSGTFRGANPFSEPCTQNLRNYMASFQNVKAYVDYHCCGNVLLPPWAYTRDFPPDEPLHSAMCQRMVDRIREYSGSTYNYGSNLFSNDSGTIQDYAYGVLQILYGMTIELPSAANTNPDLIIGVGLEIFEAVKVMAQIILEEGV